MSEALSQMEAQGLPGDDRSPQTLGQRRTASQPIHLIEGDVLRSCHSGSDTVASQGKTLHVAFHEVDHGKPAIIFVPGMGCHAGVYEEFLRGLAEKGFNVIGVDLPGHGQSSGKRGVFTFEEVMTAITDVVTYAIDRYGPRVGLMGSSLGGTFALYAALHDMRLKAVLCHDAMDISQDLPVPTRWPSLTRFLIRRLRLMAQLVPWLPVPLRVLVNWHHVVESEGLLRSLRRDPGMVWYYSLGSWNSFLAYPRKDLSRIAAPVKIIVGDRDILFPPEHCRKIAQRVGEHGASFEVLDGGHALPLEQVPQMIRVVSAWFEQQLACTG